MRYEYECEKCETRTERHFRMGQATRTVKCGSCGSRAKRVYNSFALGINGAIDRTSSFGEDMRKKNAKAGRRMKTEHSGPPVRHVANDFGNGDVREV